jgi:hypothetical protein
MEDSTDRATLKEKDEISLENLYQYIGGGAASRAARE